MKLTRIAMAAALLMSGGAAVAQSATDAGCILVSNAFAKNAKDDNAKKLAEASLYFYLGRLGDSATPAQLKTLFEQQAKTITDAKAGPMMNACASKLQAKMQMLQSMSQPPQKPEGR
jgi:hypothetical protein